MQEIEVFLIQDAAGNPTIQTEPSIVGVHSGDNVVWNFHSLLDDVRWVEIDFKADKTGYKAQFFDVRGNSKDFRRYTELKNGHGQITGSVPPRPGGPGTRGDKYFIRGYANAPNPYDPKQALYELDPPIITCDP